METHHAEGEVMETDHSGLYGPWRGPTPWDRASDEPPCEARYNGRFWSPRPCRMARDHRGAHADLYGRTWASPDDHEFDQLEPEEG